MTERVSHFFYIIDELGIINSTKLLKDPDVRYLKTFIGEVFNISQTVSPQNPHLTTLDSHPDLFTDIEKLYILDLDEDYSLKKLLAARIRPKANKNVEVRLIKP